MSQFVEQVWQRVEVSLAAGLRCGLSDTPEPEGQNWESVMRKEKSE